MFVQPSHFKDEETEIYRANRSSDITHEIKSKSEFKTRSSDFLIYCYFVLLYSMT